MKRLHSNLVPLLFGLIFSLLALLETPWHARWEGAMLDGLFQVQGATDHREDIVILGINSESMEFLDDEVEENPDLDLLTGWPWPRRAHALLLEKLVAAGARAVAFDILFLNPSPYGEDDDAAFREALAKHRDHVVIGFDFDDLETRSGRARVVMPAESVAPEDLRADVAGFVRYPKDGDGTVRRAHFQTTPGVASGVSFQPMAGEEFLLSLPAMAARKHDPAVYVPDWREGPLIRFAGPPRTYPHRPVFQVFHDRYWQTNLGGGEFFRDKIVLVGATAGFMHDAHQTPFRTMDGVEIHANVIGMLLDGNYLREIPFFARVVLTLLAGLGVGSGILLWRGSYLLRFFLLLGAAATGVLASIGLFYFAGVVVAFPHPYIALLGAGFSGMAVQFTAEQVEKRRLRRTFATFVSPDVAEYLVEHPEEYETAAVGKRRHCVILFSDVRGFTTMTEQAKSPEAFVHQLNEYLTAWVECVFAKRGTLDKFVGDAVMAVWGGIRSEGPREDALAAVEAALRMRAELKRLNVKWKKEGRPEFRMGVGIAAGETMVGNMGSPGRKMEFTVIGDAVNLAARLEGETKSYAREMLVSEEVYALVKNEVETEYLGEAKVRGRTRGAKIYAVLERGKPEGPPESSADSAERGGRGPIVEAR